MRVRGRAPFIFIDGEGAHYAARGSHKSAAALASRGPSPPHAPPESKKDAAEGTPSLQARSWDAIRARARLLRWSLCPGLLCPNGPGYVCLAAIWERVGHNNNTNTRGAFRALVISGYWAASLEAPDSASGPAVRGPFLANVGAYR